jgi:hypothetical protein
VLKLHRVQHYGSKCYKCTICDETFKNKKEMEAHIKGHANDINDDENGEEMTSGRSPSAASQQTETKHSILLNTPSNSSSATPSPNGHLTLNHSIIPKYENGEGSSMMNFAEQFSIMNSSSSAAASAASYPDTPKDSEASSEQNSDGDDVTYMNMYSRFEQGAYGVSAALSATLQPITPTSNNGSSLSTANNSNLITLKPIHQQQANVYEMNARSNGYFASNVQQANDYK